LSRTLRQQVYRELFARPEGDEGLTITNQLVMATILVSIVVAVLSTEPRIARNHGSQLLAAEMAFGIVFLVEYAARLWSVAEAPGTGSAAYKRWRFARSVIGIIDLAVVVATLFPFLVTSASVFRIVRLLRLVELMQSGRFSLALREIGKAVSERRYDLFVTLALAGGLILTSATALYWAEGEVQPAVFGSIPRAMWWAVITLTSVGYGDAVPVTVLGKVFASFVALGSIALIALPTGVLAAAFSDGMERHRKRVDAARHLREGHHE
jgi:voltage-gated potassium channel